MSTHRGDSNPDPLPSPPRRARQPWAVIPRPTALNSGGRARRTPPKRLAGAARPRLHVIVDRPENLEIVAVHDFERAASKRTGARGCHPAEADQGSRVRPRRLDTRSGRRYLCFRTRMPFSVIALISTSGPSPGPFSVNSM